MVTSNDIRASSPPHKAELIYNADVLHTPPWRWLQPVADQATPIAAGRGSAWFVTLTDVDRPAIAAVLRHYRRGGLPARLVPAHWYFYAGAQRTRCVREYQLLRALHASGLPVPEPLAAAWWRRGIGVRQALLMRQLAHTRSLATQVREHGEAPWREVGRTLARFHAAGVWHADLNAHNVLIDDARKVWLIDFDRGRQGPLTLAEARRNLDRLERSLRKLQAYDAQGWAALLTAWEQAMAAAPGACAG